MFANHYKRVYTVPLVFSIGRLIAMNLSEIPKKDIRIIEDVADHVVRRNNLPTYSDDDLQQELILEGLKGYIQYWNEDKQEGKSEPKRDSNLRIYMRNFLNNRMRNLYRSITTKKNSANVGVVSFNPSDEVMQKLFTDTDEYNDIDFESLGVTEDQLMVLKYIAKNNLGIQGSTQEDMSNELGITKNKIINIMKELGQDSDLKNFLIQRLT